MDQIIQALLNDGKDWVDYLSALLTPFLAIFAMFITYQQWNTNRRRLKNELFDRRYEYFIAIREFIKEILATNASHSESQYKFLRDTRGLRFVFDKDIDNFVHEKVWKPAMEVEAWNGDLEGLPVGEERKKAVAKRRELREQLSHALQSLEEKFTKYMQLKH